MHGHMPMYMHLNTHLGRVYACRREVPQLPLVYMQAVVLYMAETCGAAGWQMPVTDPRPQPSQLYLGGGGPLRGQNGLADCDSDEEAEYVEERGVGQKKRRGQGGVGGSGGGGGGSEVQAPEIEVCGWMLAG